mmetsp:Transcript_16490/g.37648  ORF Transcript_16490/g.37648 Transcript_16490/m.37648 type:complete len:216 (-) Transcript_16490:1121-1768(-)
MQSRLPVPSREEEVRSVVQELLYTSVPPVPSRVVQWRPTVSVRLVRICVVLQQLQHRAHVIESRRKVQRSPAVCVQLVDVCTSLQQLLHALVPLVCHAAAGVVQGRHAQLVLQAQVRSRFQQLNDAAMVSVPRRHVERTPSLLARLVHQRLRLQQQPDGLRVPVAGSEVEGCEAARVPRVEPLLLDVLPQLAQRVVPRGCVRGPCAELVHLFGCS